MKFSILTIIGLVILFTMSSHQPDLPSFTRDEKIFLAAGGLYLLWIGFVIFFVGTILSGIFRWARKQ